MARILRVVTSVGGLIIINGIAIFLIGVGSGHSDPGVIYGVAGGLLLGLLLGLSLWRHVAVAEVGYELFLAARILEYAISTVPRAFSHQLIQTRYRFQHTFERLGITAPPELEAGSYVLEGNTGEGFETESFQDAIITFLLGLHELEDGIARTRSTSPAAAYLRQTREHLWDIGRLLRLPLPREAYFGEALAADELQRILPTNLVEGIEFGRRALNRAIEQALHPGQWELLEQTYELFELIWEFFGFPKLEMAKHGSAVPSLSLLPQLFERLINHNAELGDELGRLAQILGGTAVRARRFQGRMAGAALVVPEGHLDALLQTLETVLADTPIRLARLTVEPGDESETAAPQGT